MEASLKAGQYYHIVTVAKSHRNPYLNSYITEKRKEAIVTLLLQSKTTSRELIKHINSNNIIALLSDHWDKGARVEFIGKETMAPTGAISLALKYQVFLILAYNIMHKDNTCTTNIVEVELVKTGNFKDDVFQIT